MKTAPKIIHSETADNADQLAEQYELTPVIAQVLAARCRELSVSPEPLLTPSLANLHDPGKLPDIQPAVERLSAAIDAGEVIALETDHDVDGVSSHALLRDGLVRYFDVPLHRIRSFIGNRLTEGYGLSDPVADRILADPSGPSLVITADNGSTDAERIARLKAAGVDVIVTDHHGMPAEGPPARAVACVNPARVSSEYPDPMIAGVCVAWLLLCQLRRYRIEQGQMPPDSPKLTELLDFVALGTVADCVSMARSEQNRALVRAGLAEINAQRRPAWRVAAAAIAGQGGPLVASDIAFSIGPRINARGRLDDAMAGVEFLMADNDRDAGQWWHLLERENTKRKEVERELRDEAFVSARVMTELGRRTMVISFAKGHAGVHGIVASRVVEATGRPTICFSQQTGEPGILVGSCRGVPGMHMRDALERISEQHPGLIEKFGGHKGAAGLKVRTRNLQAFDEAFEREVSEQLGGRDLSPKVTVDAQLSLSQINQKLLDDLKRLEPFGQEFPEPVFWTVAEVRDLRARGDGTHWQLGMDDGTAYHSAMWFAAGEDPPVAIGDQIELAYSVSENWFRGVPRTQLRVSTARKLETAPKTGAA